MQDLSKKRFSVLLAAETSANTGGVFAGVAMAAGEIQIKTQKT